MGNYQDIREELDKRIITSGKSLTGVMDLLQDQWKRDFNVMTLAKVEQIDRESRKVLVRPLNKILFRDREPQMRKLVLCTVWQFAAGGFTIDLPIKEGDVGWVIAADRECDEGKDSHEAYAPNTISSHCYDYGFFIPDYQRQVKNEAKEAQKPYDGENGRLVISTYDGTQKLSIGGDSIRIKSKANGGETKIVIAGGKVTIESPSEVNMTATKTTITGDVTVNGTFDATVIKTTAGVSLGTHKHSQNGSSPICPS